MDVYGESCGDRDEDDCTASIVQAHAMFEQKLAQKEQEWSKFQI
jgi:hypothetical protein